MTLDRKRLRTITGLATPIVLGMLSQNLLNLVDTAFVGRLGPEALAAVGMGGFANWLLVSFLLGLGSGVQAIAARRFGEGQHGKTAMGLNAALILAVAIGVPAAVLGVALAPEIFSALNEDPAVRLLGSGYLAARFVATPCVAANVAFRGYWNGINRPTYYMGTLVLMHAVNIVLDWALIFGHLGLPELGAVGAGWATTIAVTGGTVLHLCLGLGKARNSGFLRVRGSMSVLSTLVRLSLPACLQQFFFSAGFVAFFVIAGRVGTSALAASSVLVNLTLLCVLPGVGIGLAGASLAGQALGRGDIRDARAWSWQVVGLGSVFMGAIGLVLAVGARTWLGFFVEADPQTLEIAVLPLQIIGLVQAIDAVAVVLSNVLMGVGDTLAMLGISVATQWIVFLPTAAAVSLLAEGGLLGLWACMAGWRALLAMAVVLRFRGDAWSRHRV